MKLVEMSLLDSKDIVNTISAVVPNEIYNLASISSVARSILEPELTHEVNSLGPVRIIDAVSSLGLRNSVKMYQASSFEMFGKAVVFQLAKKHLSVPALIAGGALNPKDFEEALMCGADGVISGTYFAKRDQNPMQLKARLATLGIPVRKM
jgi:GDP-D-mannose dehydratase